MMKSLNLAAFVAAWCTENLVHNSLGDESFAFELQTW